FRSLLAQEAEEVGLLIVVQPDRRVQPDGPAARQDAAVELVVLGADQPLVEETDPFEDIASEATVGDRVGRPLPGPDPEAGVPDAAPVGRQRLHHPGLVSAAATACDDDAADVVRAGPDRRPYALP